MPTDTQKKTINVTECVAGYSGTSERGDYTIFDIKALQENGQPVPVKLRAFSEVPLGLAEYEMEKYTNKNNEVSWTLKTPRSGGVTPQAFNDLVKRVTDLEAIVRGSDATPPAVAGGGVADEWGASSTNDDDDIPF
jgi:hypothetical protein